MKQLLNLPLFNLSLVFLNFSLIFKDTNQDFSTFRLILLAHVQQS
jgi:hypothetical protein